MVALRALRGLLTSRLLVWFVLAVPGIRVLVMWLSGSVSYGQVVSDSGHWAVALLIPTTATTPLRLLFPRSRWVTWLIRWRLDLGGACLGYAALHAATYAVGKGDIVVVLRDARLPWLLAGWFALAIFTAYAATRPEIAGRVLTASWPRLHRVTYVGAALVLLHWAFSAFDPLTEKVQEALRAHGYYDGPIDGVIGPLSRDALRRFQSDQGLPVTGRISSGVLDIVGIVPN